MILNESIVLIDATKFLLFLAVAKLSSDAIAETEPNESVPAPSVTSACPLDPSATGILYVVPPDVNIKFVPSELIASLASVNFIFPELRL